ncbi:MAG TPA: carboxylesterase family protein [Terracidiphilus sp.]|nr:carboxylesterase family protein [Terracidiphilus sp.]
MCRFVLRFAAHSFTIAILLFLVSASAQPGPPVDTDKSLVVRTTTGELSGVARAGRGAEFLGIPYAQAPVGDLRWREPVAAKPWVGTLNATKFGSPCSQPDLGGWNRHDAETGKEDCLFLNVIVPEWPVSKPLPVMFWIHGGANEGGTASSALYKDGTLVNHGVILVTVNYRLGIFGFLAHPELTAESAHHASGNYGLMDQLLALHWVRDNIALFGGDVNNITVFGQSAGAMDTSMLMTSPLAKGLFQKALAESGAAFTAPLLPLAQAEQSGTALAKAFNAPSADGQIKYLRTLSASEMLAAQAKLSPANRLRVGPDIDGFVLPQQPVAVFESGQEEHIPFVYGTTTREFGSNQSADQLRMAISFVAGAFAGKAIAAYGLANGGQGNPDPKYGTAADQWSADMIFRCPSVTQAAYHVAAHDPTWEYEFNHAIPGQEAQGAVHSADLPYVFGFFPKTGNIAGNFTDIDKKLADLMETYWTNFAKNGNPNSSGLPNWPQQVNTGTYIQFQQDGKVEPADALRAAQCTIYREWLTAQSHPAH